LTEDKIISLLERLGCRRIRVRGDNVHSTCPQESSHKGGRDRNPSFGVLVNDSGVSKANCLACGFNDSAEWIARTHGWSDLAGEFRTKVDNRSGGYLWVPPTNKGIWDIPEEPFLPPGDSVDKYTGQVPQYILDRGFTLDTCKAWELGYDLGNKRLIFVVRDLLGRLRGISGRTLVNHPAKYLHYVWDHKNGSWSPGYNYDRFDDFEKWKKASLFYGEHMIDWERIPEHRRDTLILVEGHTDSMWLWQNQWNAISVMGSSISDAQAATVLKLLPEGGRVVTIGDGDDGGRTMAKSIKEALSTKIPCFEVILPDGSDPQDIKPSVVESIIAQSRPVVG
jgi:hypothetical protein